MTIDEDHGDAARAGLPGGRILRTPGRGYAGLLARLGESSFREAWGAHNDPADMDAYCAAHFTEAGVLRDLDREDVGFLVAESAGEAVGYLRWSTGAAPSCVIASSPFEVSRIYVLRRWHGHGYGPALMAEGLRLAAAAGHDVAWLAVWQRALQPLAFYRKWGFAIVGSATFRLGADLQQDHVMVRPLP